MQADKILYPQSMFVSRAEVDSAQPMLELLRELCSEQKLTSVAYHYAAFVYVEMGNTDCDFSLAEMNLVLVSAAALMQAVQQQNACTTQRQIQQFYQNLLQQASQSESINDVSIASFASWSKTLTKATCLTSVLGDEENQKASLWTLDEDRLYLNRYAKYEQTIVTRILAALNQQIDVSSGALNRFVASMFETSESGVDWQRIAVQNALGRQFSVITGGPGTGKTTTVVKLLNAITKRYQLNEREPVIKLAAPTGKAAARLSESIRNSLSKQSSEFADVLPTEAETLHRLLKQNRTGEAFYSQTRPMPADVVVVDEASMVDLSMMAKLINALRPDTQLILLGDKHQLASVEAGSVLAEICDVQAELNVNIVTELQKSYRFDGKGEIGRFAISIKLGNVQEALTVLNQSTASNGQVQLSASSAKSFAKLQRMVLSHYQKVYALLVDLSVENEAARINQAFSTLSQLQLLTCTKVAEFGTDNINRLVTDGFRKANHLPAWQSHYVARPIMIAENAYALDLFNGDIGIQAKDPQSGQMMTYFPDLCELGFRKIACQRLPKHDTVYAMTVHKSQGSEFDHAIMIMPDANQTKASVSRELLYTGLTRAKTRFTLMATEQSIAQSIANETQRHSGIKASVKKALQKT